MLDRAETPLTAEAGPALPIAQLILGKSARDAAQILPRVFNLCRTAQSTAARLAFGLPLQDDDDLASEIERDHVFRLALVIGPKLGVNASDVQGALGQTIDIPGRPDQFDAWMTTDAPLPALLAAITTRFSGGAGCASGLDAVNDSAVFARAACENSVAARHMDHPVMRHIETRHGRGPLWRVAARLLDLQACRAGDLPAPRMIGPGRAIVPAARGAYAIRAEVAQGHVTAFDRVTPTDHLMAQGGIMEQSLATLPADAHNLAPLLVDILDPCSPVELKGGRNA